jgi:hypothetical protein
MEALRGVGVGSSLGARSRGLPGPKLPPVPDEDPPVIVDVLDDLDSRDDPIAFRCCSRPVTVISEVFVNDGESAAAAAAEAFFLRRFLFPEDEPPPIELATTVGDVPVLSSYILPTPAIEVFKGPVGVGVTRRHSTV